MTYHEIVISQNPMDLEFSHQAMLDFQSEQKHQTLAEKAYDDFWQFVESEADKYEITCDYYLMEFY